MEPIVIQDWNVTLGKPENMTDEQCVALKVKYEKWSDGSSTLSSAWMPSDEERALIAQGKPIILVVHGIQHPPVALVVRP